MLVVDASFAIDASLTATGLDRLEGHGAIAPPLMWSETFSVLHEMLHRRVITALLAGEARRRIERAPIEPRNPADLLDRAWDIASRAGWAKTYDAEYVALAQLAGCPLLTLDARLVRAAQGEAGFVDPADL
jgi:predicted nucleic acid-binding protein